MRKFGKNVFRLAAQNKGSFLGAVCIIAIGIFVYVAMMDTLENLKGQVDAYYEQSALADVFAEVAGISQAELTGLLDISGIQEVSGKMAADIRILGSGQEEIVTVHLLSYDETDTLNRLSLSKVQNDAKAQNNAKIQSSIKLQNDASGHDLRGDSGASASATDALFLGARMAAEYGYQSGEPLKLLWAGDAVDVTFAGTCYAPDYIYSIPPGGAMIPDGAVYDIACIDKERMEEITGRRDILNELGFRLEPGVSFEDVRLVLTQRLKGFGLISLSSKEKQVSYDMVNGEIGELISVGTILPVLFLAISVFMLYVVLKKMIDRDQGLIGTMKAFGMTDGELMGAYLVEGAAAGAAGAVLGSILAVPFGIWMFAMYVDFFNLPDTVYHNFLGSRLSGLALAVGTGILAVFLGVRDILSITPAQAMRAKAPALNKMLSVPDFLAKRLSPLSRMGLRMVMRNPFRGFLIMLAVAFPFSMSSVLFSFEGVADQMYMDQFEKIQIYDFQASLAQYVSSVRARQSAEFLDGVEEVEAVCVLPVTFKKENHMEFAVLYGLHENSDLWRILDNRGMYYEPSPYGVILNSRTAAKLRVKKGDTIWISCAGMTVEDVEIPVWNVIEESLGSGCYMSLSGFEQIFQTGAVANTVILKAQDGMAKQVKEKLLETNQVEWLVDVGKIVDSYRDMMGSMLMMMYLFSLLSVAAGGILIYNISMVNIRERETELGTLQILGTSEKEMGWLICMEQMVYFVLGILLGIPGCYGIKYLVEHLVVSDSYSIHLIVPLSSYILSFFICLGITILSLLIEIRFAGKIQLTDILKERE